ncbi:MAG: hypothetical protein IMY71_13575 [Bacteroidetes bacterium]|nr:hypothetical protein [Bacteroidota bacterium]
MTLNKIFSILLLLSITSGCSYIEKRKYKKYINRTVERLYKSELILPDSVKNFDSISLPEFFYSNLHKCQIISWLDGNCHTCIQALRIWEEEIIQKSNPDYVNFIFIIHPSDYEYFMKIIFPDISTDIPIFIDVNNDFVNVNELFMLDNYLLTFLIDTEGKIKLIGNPLNNQELQDLYFQEINIEPTLKSGY